MSDMKTFTSKEDAEKYLNDNTFEFMPRQFCPLIKDTCKDNCVCYIEPKVAYLGKEYKIYEGFCGNRMFNE